MKNKNPQNKYLIKKTTVLEKVWSEHNSQAAPARSLKPNFLKSTFLFRIHDTEYGNGYSHCPAPFVFN